MSTDSLITVLEEIRDQQKQQIANYERALATQDQALGLQRHARRFFLFLLVMPWLVILVLLVALLTAPHVLH